MSVESHVFFHKRIVAGVQHRQDPLFESWTRINPQRAKRVKHTGSARNEEDVLRLVTLSRQTCPFCPERRMTETPTFPKEMVPEGRLVRNESILFPNKDPYGEHHGVGILTDAHYVPMEAYREETIRDSILLTQDFFRSIHRRESSARFPVYVWNFLPPSAGSIVHPHIQVLLETRPAPIIQVLTERCRVWMERHGEDFWKRLVEEESGLDERLIWRQEGLAVLASFAPRGFREIVILLPASGSLADLTGEAVRIFSWCLVRLLRAYHAMGVGSFNLVTYSPPIGQFPAAFPFHAKLISRPYPSGIYTNDTGFFERMYDLWIIDTLPEEVARQARPFLHHDRPSTPTST